MKIGKGKRLFVGIGFPEIFNWYILPSFYKDAYRYDSDGSGRIFYRLKFLFFELYAGCTYDFNAPAV